MRCASRQVGSALLCLVVASVAGCKSQVVDQGELASNAPPTVTLPDGAPMPILPPVPGPEPTQGPPVPPQHNPAVSPPPPHPAMSADGFTVQEVELYRTLSPLPDVPEDTTNAYADDPVAADLGQLLFFDPGYSGPLAVGSDLGKKGKAGKVACVSCHWGEYLDDQRSPAPLNVSLGVKFHSRNALPIINSAFYRWTNWAGRFSSQWELSLAVAESGVIMNSSRLAIAHHIFDNYREAYEEVFGPLDPGLGDDLMRFPPEGKPKPAATPDNPDPADGPWESMTDADRYVVNSIFANYGKALQAYIRLIVSRNAPFDRFVQGEESMSSAAKRGLKLFVGRARCVNCHSGPHFSDDYFHNTGVPQTGPHVPAEDLGRYKDIRGLLSSPFNSGSEFSDDPGSGRLAGLTDPPPAETKGQFRTPSLRGVGLTAPYMHSGQLRTLWEVVDFYDRGGDQPVVGEKDRLMVPLHLSHADKQDLIAFLDSLRGEHIPDHLIDEGMFEPPPADW